MSLMDEGRTKSSLHTKIRLATTNDEKLPESSLHTKIRLATTSDERLPDHSRSPSFDENTGLRSEEYFNELLDIERRRAERGGERFLLWLLNINNCTNDIERTQVCDNIVSLLPKLSRMIDTKGWYRYRSTIGVIIPEIDEIDNGLPKGEMPSSIYQRFVDIADPEYLNKIKMAFHYFPEGLIQEVVNSSIDVSLISSPEAAINGKSYGCPIHGRKSESLVVDRRARKETRFPEGIISFGSLDKRLMTFVGDLFLIVVATLLSFWINDVTLLKGIRDHLELCILATLFIPAALYTFDMYNMGRIFSSRESIIRIVVAILLGGLLLAAGCYLILHSRYSRAILLFQILGILFLISTWRIFYGTFFQKSLPRIRTLIVGAGEKGKFIYRLLNSPLSPYDVRGFLDDDPAKQGTLLEACAVMAGIDQLPEIAEKTWAKVVILATSQNRHPRIVSKILDVRLRGVEVLDLTTIYERLTGRVPVRQIEDDWLVFSDGFFLLSKSYVQRVKRLMDIFFSGLLLMLFSPLIPLTALLIRVDSTGPVLYRQERVGKRGKIFTVLKFRSMYQNAESQGSQWAEKNDLRVTRVGRVIRLLRIDEIPQLWNIFNGNMSLIGPRPERPEFVEKLKASIPYYHARHAVAPGLTGWAQVCYRYGASTEDALNKLEYDLYYIKNMSILLDLQIILRTIGVVLLGQGAR